MPSYKTARRATTPQAMANAPAVFTFRPWKKNSPKSVPQKNDIRIIFAHCFNYTRQSVMLAMKLFTCNTVEKKDNGLKSFRRYLISVQLKYANKSIVSAFFLVRTLTIISQNGLFIAPIHTNTRPTTGFVSICVSVSLSPDAFLCAFTFFLFPRRIKLSRFMAITQFVLVE